MPRLTFLALAANDSPESFPLGVACVAAAVRSRLGDRVEISILDEPLPGAMARGGLPVDEDSGAIGRVVDLVLRGRPDWLGLSVFTWNREAMTRVARACKEARPDLLVFAGGPEAGADSERLLSEAPFDFIVRGEGESATADALSSLLAGNREGAAGVLPRKARSEELQLLPSPWLSGFALPKQSGVLWELARGCPYRCSYCYEGKGERGTRRIPLARAEAELELFARSGVRQAFVLDPTFDADREGAKRLLDLIARKAPQIHWKFEIRAELVDRELARRFAALSSSLQVGLQTADPAVSAACGRPLDLKAFARGLEKLNEAGCVFGIDLIYGLPGDSLSGLMKSLDYALGFQPNHLDIFPLAVLPGTELADRAEESGLVVQGRAPHLVLSTPTFPAADLARAGKLAEACDLLYSRGRAVSWFLQALRPLGMKPHALLGRFADFLAARPLPTAATAAGSRDLEALQLGFLEAEYGRKGLEALVPALRDLVRFNAAWGRALAEGEASTLELAYDPDEVLGPAALDLRAFARAARQRPGRWTVSPGSGGPELRKARPGRSS